MVKNEVNKFTFRTINPEQIPAATKRFTELFYETNKDKLIEAYLKINQRQDTQHG